MFCLNCKSEFDEEDVKTAYEEYEVWGRPSAMLQKVCPYCKDCLIIADNEYHHCSCCGEVCGNDYIKTEDGNYFCEDCYTVHNIDECR